ncbi:MAG: competence/damage-inducible protein A [Clostridia bacterium]|nr:competence/damage-inducible protein A [Clostridia bacterium]
MIAEILSVGTELLLGEVTDTNAAFLSRQLSEMGIDVFFRETVGDNADRLEETIRRALGHADLVLITGGLGPTMDDITRECTAHVLGLELAEDKPSADAIRGRYDSQKMEIPSHALKQAYVPEGSTVFFNTRGTAPGSATEKGGKTVIVLPGPPHEMQEMFLRSVRPYLRERSAETIHSRVLRVFGIGEPSLEDRIADILKEQTNPMVGIYVGFGEIRIRISAKSASEEEAERMIGPVADELYRRLGTLIYAEGDTSMEACVADMLIKSGRTVSFAESCTGGMIASSLVAFPGISAALTESHVTYSNEAKMRTLGVRKETLEAYGAVSAQTAEEMAAGLRERSGADMALSVTGIAGPDGGTPEKPVGTVWMGFCDENGVTSTCFLFGGDRNRVRRMTMLNALNRIRCALIGKDR